MPGPRIERADRIALRTVEREDADLLQRAHADPEIRYPFGSRVENRSQVEDRFEDQIEDENANHYLVTVEGEGAPRGDPGDGVTPIGLVATTDVQRRRRPTLLYWLLPEYHGQGYGTEAVALAVDVLFRTHDVPGVGAGVYGFNDASRGLLESLGFELEGRLREYKFVDGEYRDLLIFGLLREGWEGPEAHYPDDSV